MLNEKKALRSRLLAERAAMSPEERQAASNALASEALALASAGNVRTVACYVSMGSEPGTRPLLDALRAAGMHVLLPVLLPDNDLDWAAYEGSELLAPARLGLLEPTGPRLGPAAVAAADLVLLPGLAVDPATGVRLGRGGGSYDRVLARLAAAGSPALLVTLLFDGELVEGLPAEPHDRPVDAVVTPQRTLRFD
ncbi:5-formyltetrahydrofolate cyclo-ligase [Streptacidiphilus jiangxiensis]|uniref:5-formyltetrahydrofolate cyclo-ligase n=1 Tax=Streptacidiphilus jiangxiensis TaxID=235985 RepID=A0A1H7FHN1_STRJI|nr:5-formyltetrahydrofolate cyclo-ligase [Streptacidiphilus jiangxiensis]SEK22795.1 5-formyltetrahydrofolate cyclo-ligase [Streptacidiphilus jiangxiensis]